MIFDSWIDLVRIVVTGSLAYLSLIVLLRVSGKRTLSKMNAFDFLVTVALGSTLSATVINQDVTLTEGFTAFALLVLGQYAITKLSSHSRAFQTLVKAEPTLLFHEGRYLEEAMKRERVTQEEIIAAMREQGVASTEEVHALVLETDGTFSVIGSSAHAKSTLANVKGVPERT